MKKLSSKKRIGEFLRSRIGQVVKGKEIQEVVPNVTEWARRVRELREEGWPIRTNNDDDRLKPGEYLLESEPPAPDSYKFSRSISSRIRAQVLERNGYTCQMCGAGAGERDEATGRKVKLHVGHIIDKSHGGQDELSNLRALCRTCNEGAKNITQEPPSWTWLLGHLRRAKVSDQRAALEWLTRKFEHKKEKSD